MEAQQEEDDAPYQAFKPAAQQAGAFFGGRGSGGGLGDGAGNEFGGLGIHRQINRGKTGRLYKESGFKVGEAYVLASQELCLGFAKTSFSGSLKSALRIKGRYRRALFN